MLPVEPGTEYARLKGLLIERGLFRRNPAHDALRIVFLLSLLAMAVGVLFLTDSLAVRLLDAVLFAFVFTQLGYVAHDSGHRQIFTRPHQNDAVLLFVGFLTGASGSWWMHNHNLHHRSPNTMDVDPHTAIPALAFSPDQALAKPPAFRGVVRFQAYYFFPLLLLQGIGVHFASALFILGGRARYRRVEALSLVFNLVIYGALIFLVMPWWQAGLFIAVHQGLMGLYMGSVFAPNHKGMLVIEPESTMDFFHVQVLTTRNLKPGFFTDLWYGGLNYQIEHHLFPTLPRSNLPKAQPFVKAFCEAHNVSYQEAGVFQSFALVFRYLDEVGQTKEDLLPVASPASPS